MMLSQPVNVHRDRHRTWSSLYHIINVIDLPQDTEWSSVVESPFLVLPHMLPGHVLIHKVSLLELNCPDSCVISFLTAIKIGLQGVPNKGVSLPHVGFGAQYVLIRRLHSCGSRLLD